MSSRSRSESSESSFTGFGENGREFEAPSHAVESRSRSFPRPQLCTRSSSNKHTYGLGLGHTATRLGVERQAEAVFSTKNERMSVVIVVGGGKASEALHAIYKIFHVQSSCSPGFTVDQGSKLGRPKASQHRAHVRTHRRQHCGHIS